MAQCQKFRLLFNIKYYKILKCFFLLITFINCLSFCLGQCDNGTFYVAATNKCEKCPVGTFNTDGSASKCRACPYGYIGETEGLSVCVKCDKPENCPVGTFNTLSSTQVNIRNGNKMKQYNNSEAISKPPSHCDEDIGDGWNMLYAMLFTSLGILIFHSCFIQTLIYFLSCCIHKETARVKVLARLDKLQSDWGSWEGDNVDDQELVPPNPSAFGAAYTLAFIPICAYTIYQLIFSNNPRCSAGLQILSPIRANGTMNWTIELPTVADTVCTTFVNKNTIGFTETDAAPHLIDVGKCNKVICKECKLDAVNELLFQVPYIAQVAKVIYKAPVAAPDQPPQVSWAYIRPKNGSWAFNDNAEIVQDFRARESFFQDKTVGRRQGVKVSRDTGLLAHSGFVIEADAPRSTAYMESQSITYNSNSYWTLRIRISREGTVQYVEKAYLQDSIQLFFAVIAGVSVGFSFWVGAFHGWLVIVINAVRKRCCKPKENYSLKDLKKSKSDILKDRIGKLENKNNNLEYKILELTTLLRNHGIVNKTNKKLEESKDVNDDNEEERNPSVVPDKEGTTSNSAENNTSMESI